MRALLRLCLLLAAVVIAGCGGSSEPGTAASGSAAGATETPATSLAASDSASALMPINASAILARVADGRAKVTIVNVWATWCLPCREEFPELLEAARAHQADGVRLMLVSTDFDEQLPQVHSFLGSHGVRDTTYFKRDGDQAFIDTLNPKWTGTIPVTLVYDRTGKRVAFWEGRADRARFEAAIQQALAAPPAATKETHS